MASARHFFARGSMSDAELTTDIQNDITHSRGAQKDLASAGQHRMASVMGNAVDEHLDELSDVKRGNWRPRHAS
ncbi:hypothetical protein [Streptomyces niveus]|uniref:hypothetical protein n=1 Tax=Streptomyces niveus TaxID=193462 RepID=UPI00344650A8